MNTDIALDSLYWFFRMIDTGGPDGSDLDYLVYDEAREAANWLVETNTNSLDPPFTKEKKSEKS